MQKTAWVISAMETEVFRQRLLSLREARKESLNVLALAVGSSKGYLSALETGRAKNPAAFLVARLAKHFGCTTDFLLGISDQDLSRSEAADIVRYFTEIMTDPTKRSEFKTFQRLTR